MKDKIIIRKCKVSCKCPKCQVTYSLVLSIDIKDKTKLYRRYCSKCRLQVNDYKFYQEMPVTEIRLPYD